MVQSEIARTSQKKTIPNSAKSETLMPKTDSHTEVEESESN